MPDATEVQFREYCVVVDEEGRTLEGSELFESNAVG